VAGTGNDHSPEQVATFLAAWHEDLIAELCENRTGLLKHRQPKLTTLIPNDFPDLHILKLYTHLNTLQGQAGFVMSLLASNRAFDMVAIAHFAKRNFVWAKDADSALHHFDPLVFSGIAVRELVRHAVLLDQGALHHPVTLPLIGDVLLYRFNKSSSYQKVACVKLHFGHEYITSICQAVSDTRDAHSANEIIDVCAWVPAAMLKHVIPESNDKDSTLGDDIPGLPFIHESPCVISDVREQIRSV
jgi:hypothetical protein